jgi:hypothetical protein
MRSIGDVATHVAGAIRGSGGFADLAAQLLDRLGNDVGQAHSEMVKSIEAGASLSELQERFLACYRAYQGIVYPMRDAGVEGGYPWANDGNYNLWKSSDEEFLRCLDELTLSSAFTDLRPQVAGLMWPDGGRREYWA